MNRINFEQKDRIGVLTLNRPEKYNAQTRLSRMVPAFGMHVNSGGNQEEDGS